MFVPYRTEKLRELPVIMSHQGSAYLQSVDPFVPFVSALLVQSIFLKENQKGDCWVQSIYKPAVFFKENQKGDAYSVYPGVFTRWILGLWFSLKVHGLQIGAPVTPAALLVYKGSTASGMVRSVSSTPPIPSTCCNHFILLVVVEKERRTLVGPWWCNGSTRYGNYLEDYWSSAGGLSFPHPLLV